MEEIFWNSIADYNAATWPWQIALMSIAAVLTLILRFRPAPWAKTAMKIYMVAVSLWIAFVYYMAYGSVRDYSNVMTIFWCLIALSWLYDLATGFSTFQRSGKSEVWGIIMLVLPLAYPFISISRGLVFPQITTASCTESRRSAAQAVIYRSQNACHSSGPGPGRLYGGGMNGLWKRIDL